jgi:MFS family permease
MFKGWWVVGTHFSVQFFATGFFVYSLPLLFDTLVEAFDTDLTTINYLPSLASLVGLFIAPIAGPLVDRWSAKALMLIGGAAFIIALVGLSLSQTIFQLLLVGALLFGIAQTLLGPMTGSAVVSRWFTVSRGRALGIAAIGTSMGGIVLPNLIASALPDLGWRTTLQLVAAGMAVIGMPMLLFCFWNKPSDAGLQAEPLASDPAGPTPSQDQGGTPALATTKDVLRRPAFWYLSLCLGLFLSVYAATLANLGQHGSDLGLEVDQIGRLVSVLAIAGIAGKLAFGYMADRAPLKLGLATSIVLTALTLVLFSLEQNYTMMLAGAISMGLAAGGIMPVWNAMVPAIFGVENFGRAMGLMSPVISLMAAPAFPIAGYLRDTTGSYVPAFQSFLGALLLALLLLIPLRVSRTQETPKTA